MGFQLLHAARHLPAANDPHFSPREPISSRHQLLGSICFDQQALFNALVLRGVPQPVAECLLFDTTVHQQFLEWHCLETATPGGWQLKLIHHLYQHWRQQQRPRTVASYLQHGRLLICAPQKSRRRRPLAMRQLGSNSARS